MSCNQDTKNANDVIQQQGGDVVQVTPQQGERLTLSQALLEQIPSAAKIMYSYNNNLLGKVKVSFENYRLMKEDLEISFNEKKLLAANSPESSEEFVAVREDYLRKVAALEQEHKEYLKSLHSLSITPEIEKQLIEQNRSDIKELLQKVVCELKNNGTAAFCPVDLNETFAKIKQIRREQTEQLVTDYNALLAKQQPFVELAFSKDEKELYQKVTEHVKNNLTGILEKDTETTALQNALQKIIEMPKKTFELPPDESITPEDNLFLEKVRAQGGVIQKKIAAFNNVREIFFEKLCETPSIKPVELLRDFIKSEMYKKTVKYDLGRILAVQGVFTEQIKLLEQTVNKTRKKIELEAFQPILTSQKNAIQNLRNADRMVHELAYKKEAEITFATNCHPLHPDEIIASLLEEEPYAG